MRMTMTPQENFNPNDDRAFEAALQGALHERAHHGTPGGLEQRLLARLAQAAEPEFAPTRSSAASALFASPELGKSQRSAASLWTAVGVHAAAIAFIAFVVAAKTGIVMAPKPAVPVADLSIAPPPPPPALHADKMAGGGGQRDFAPASVGRLPKFSPEQILKPTQAPRIEARLNVEPTVNVQTNLKMADNNMANLGLPNSTLPGASLGNGTGSGIGSGNGNGVGPGSGGNTGGGVFRVGGSILKPELLSGPDPEFSEEARKAKFSGNVEVYLIVDEQGNPSHVKVARGVGMGLDERAVEAVRQYRFKPATRNGKPVKVELYVDVDFNIY